MRPASAACLLAAKWRHFISRKPIQLRRHERLFELCLGRHLPALSSSRPHTWFDMGASVVLRFPAVIHCLDEYSTLNVGTCTCIPVQKRVTLLAMSVPDFCHFKLLAMQLWNLMTSSITTKLASSRADVNQTMKDCASRSTGVRSWLTFAQSQMRSWPRLTRILVRSCTTIDY